MPEMPIERPSRSHVELLDHIIDKGIVMDASVHVPPQGIDLEAMHARVQVASAEARLEHERRG